MAQIVALVIAVGGLGTLIFAALSWRRNDTTALVGQQTEVLNSIHLINDELRVTADALRSERDKCYEEVAKLRRTIERRLDDGG